MEQALPVTEALSPPASRAWYAGLKESLNLLDDDGFDDYDESGIGVAPTKNDDLKHSLQYL